jgi:hypothetical protein
MSSLSCFMRSQVARFGAPALSQDSRSTNRYTGRLAPRRTGSGVRPLAASLNHWARLMPQASHGLAVARGRSRTMRVFVVSTPELFQGMAVKSVAQWCAHHLEVSGLLDERLTFLR